MRFNEYSQCKVIGLKLTRWSIVQYTLWLGCVCRDCRVYRSTPSIYSIFKFPIGPIRGFEESIGLTTFDKDERVNHDATTRPRNIISLHPDTSLHIHTHSDVLSRYRFLLTKTHDHIHNADTCQSIENTSEWRMDSRKFVILTHYTTVV